MENVNLKINGLNVTVPAGSTILEAAHAAGIRIPTLCYLKEINEIGACRMCVVEVKGARNLVAACVYPVSEGMEVLTNTQKLIESRKRTLELLLSVHDKKCLSCVRSGHCELQELCQELGVEDEDHFAGEMPHYEPDTSAVHMVRDNNKCILCRRCSAVCEKVQSVGVIGPNNRGFATFIGSAFEMGLGDTSCVGCGQCIAACPTGALYEKDNTADVLAAIANETKHVVVQPAPSVRAALGEEFGYPMGTDVEGKMAAALRRIGFDKVFDTDFSADLTIMEEANEFIGRVQNGGVLPMITSCSPGWIKYCEHYYPDQLAHLSSCKSPQQMFGAVTKTYYAEKMGLNPKDIVCVSVMPCTAKKFEIRRDDQDAAGVPDVDISITTRELARLIRKVGINFRALPEEGFDDPLGESTGAGVIFGATGGVMEAALRTAYHTVTGENPEIGEQSPLKVLRQIGSFKELEIDIKGVKLHCAALSSLGEARRLIQAMKRGECHYDFVEVMACPGGCINGGGQPIRPSFQNKPKDCADRDQCLRAYDVNSAIRFSHENQAVQTLYDEYLEAPLSDRAHHLLHVEEY